MPGRAILKRRFAFFNEIIEKEFGRYPMRKPHPLQPGQTIALVAPAGPIQPEEIQPFIEAASELKHPLWVGRHVYDRSGFLAGPDADRAADLNAAFANDQVKAILCVRGGYGCSRILDDLDWEIIRANPKLFIGYSDVTTLHLALSRHADLATFYGPMAVEESVLPTSKAGKEIWGLMEGACDWSPARYAGHPLKALQDGQATGRLAGGCLCLLAAAAGTPEQPVLDGCIVALEDTNEALYRVDRMLTQLIRAGCLQNAAGFLLGNATNWQQLEESPEEDALDRIWLDRLGPLGKPILAGAPIGHEPQPLAIPLGCMARMDTAAGDVVLTESPVNAQF